MKPSSVLRKQRVARKETHIFRGLWRMMRLLTSGILRVCILLLVLGVVSVCFVSLYEYLLASPYLKLRHVDIRGASADTQKELIQSCGLDRDVSLLALDLREMKTRMERHPWVRAATLERSFPNALIVEMEMERPSAIVHMDKLYYMNRYGEVFKEVESLDGTDYPIVTGLSRTGAGTLDALRRVIEVMDALEAKGSAVSLERLSEVHIKAGGELCLFFRDLRAEVQLAGERQSQKLAALRKVVAHLKQTGRIHQVTGIDLDHPDGAVVSFGKG